MIQIMKSVEKEAFGFFWLHFSSFFFFSFYFFFLLLLSPCYSSVPAVHLITTVYSTVVRTRECVRDGGGASN